MNQTADRVAQLGVRLLLDALSERTSKATSAQEPTRIEGCDAWLARADIGGQPLSVCVAFLVPPVGNGPWYEAKAALEARIGGALDGAYVLWAPSGAELPGREPHRSDVIARTEEVARRFVPGGHGEVRFPVVLTLRKSDEEGSYLTARGGLASAWAQFTGRVFGHYQLDSTELHRLPAGEGHLKSLIDHIVERANTLELGQTVEIETEDAWTMQRLSAGKGLLIVGEPPGAELSSGAALRRNLRRAMQALRGPLLAQAGAARVVCFIGPYADFKDQPVGTALLGFDPTLYTGIDQILLAADGEVAPILDLTRSVLLSEGVGSGE